MLTRNSRPFTPIDVCVKQYTLEVLRLLLVLCPPSSSRKGRSSAAQFRRRTLWLTLFPDLRRISFLQPGSRETTRLNEKGSSIAIPQVAHQVGGTLKSGVGAGPRWRADLMSRRDKPSLRLVFPEE